MKQKTVLITGASRGIGRACARSFAEHGYNLILNCHQRVDYLESLRCDLESEYAISCRLSHGDISDEVYVDCLFDEIADSKDSLDVLINNAGIAHMGLLQDMTLEQWNRILSVNLTSQFLCCRRAIPLMLKQHSGSIVNTSSVWGIHGSSCETAYSAAKGGVNAFTKALARELAPSGIRVNAVAFGAVDTDMNQMLDDTQRVALCEEIPFGRMAEPDEAGDFLYDIACCHPYLTAQILTFDGGWM
ncbi:SDR family NAD(P)-dependent oxidoreductase [Ruminococcus sp. OA3]|uniref:SDR family NAD(P)-dependent oxidoreductase n=1 Tax=Ruminococcus sp. OA3 TaxID=2914164 RepID=UPI001F06DD2A|nr:SDR family NAD(P)-dependent oxidoreductase [Ruminococcus sp. OA3]MCH1984232.1 SDR family NAD(P)-dependent oxidoreductase [Ruminococcus sp. OA3]